MKKLYAKKIYIFLGTVFFFTFVFGLGTYPLLDIDETRYVTMAKAMYNTKDFLTLYLNGDYFFEKPPLFFWLESMSFYITGAVTEWSARLPIVLLSILPAGLLFALCKKVRGLKFAAITTLVLFTSLEYIFLTKIAILDSILSSFVISSVLCYFYTFFCKENHKKYFWVLTYTFSALGVLSKGIPGVAIPMIVVGVSSVVFRTYKETLKYSWGLILFLLITLPWHIIMLKLHGQIFFDEYIIKHHILRFLGSDVIHRNQPFYFYILTLLWGLFPHIIVLFLQLPSKIRVKFDPSDRYSKFIFLNCIASLSILIFFSLSKAKLITYILPIYPFTAVLLAHLWAPIIKQKRLKIFLSLIISVSLISGFLTPYIYKFDYTFGQNDLMKFAQIAKTNNLKISTYMTGRKYSLLYYGEQPKVDFQVKEDTRWLSNELRKEDTMVIIRNKYLKNLPVKVAEQGVKYSIIEIKDKGATLEKK